MIVPLDGDIYSICQRSINDAAILDENVIREAFYEHFSYSLQSHDVQ